jgi:hypothetical protein
MRIEKKNDVTYIKELDEMDKYFLDILKKFMENNPNAFDESAEEIIEEAVKRAKYTHPTGPGYNHIPAGGSLGKILGWKADGDAEWESKPIGNDGQVYYINGNISSDIKPSYILYKANIIETDQELQDAKFTLIDPSSIYNTWYRFSHDKTENQPAIATETTGWSYDSINKKIVCQTNSHSYIGFISPEKYDSYNLEVTLASSADDNDAVGVVIAFTKDSLGREYTLSVVRIRGFESHVLLGNVASQYGIVYNYGRSDQKLISSFVMSTDSVGDWSQIPKGVRLNIVREGYKITTYTSQMNSTTIDPDSKIELDLDSNELLTKFKVPCEYGYSCLSQMYSTFSDITFNKDTKYIYDSRVNQTWIGKVAGTWNLDPTRKASIEIGIGKFVFNETTKKLFYINDVDDIISFSSEYIKKSEINSYIDARLAAKGL